MQLLHRQKFMQFLFENSNNQLNTKSKYKIFFDTASQEYRLESPVSGVVYIKPDSEIFDSETSKLIDYLDLQSDLIKIATVPDPKRLDRTLNELVSHGLFVKETSGGWFNNLKEQLIKIGIDEPTAQEIDTMYPNFNRWSNLAKNAFSKLAQDKIQYSIAKIDILIHYSTQYRD